MECRELFTNGIANLGKIMSEIKYNQETENKCPYCENNLFLSLQDGDTFCKACAIITAPKENN